MAVSNLNLALKTFNSEFEESIGRFTIKVLRARATNKVTCAKHRLLGDFRMTPQEELFVKFFNETAMSIRDMSDIELQAYREELSLIALEARAKQTAVIEEDENRKKKRSGRKLTELEQRSLETDETTTDAINAINRRNQRLSKLDKVKQSLIAMGMSEAEAEQTISARNIRDTKPPNNGEEPPTSAAVSVKNDKPKPTLPSSAFVNPFEKK